MGDVVQTLPAAAELRGRFPKASIHWAIDDRWSELLLDNPHIDATVGVPMRAWRQANPLTGACAAARFVSRLRMERFDVAFDFQGLIKSSLLAASSGAGRTLGFKRPLLREQHAELLYTRSTATAVHHVVDRYRDLAAPGSGRSPAGQCAFPLPAGEPCGVLPERYVLASPQAGWGAKQWPAEHYGQLASLLFREFGVPLVADFAPGFEHRAEAIINHADRGSVIPQSSSILGLIAVTRRATAVLGVDSGPLHLAAALGRPGVAIFGPTDPDRNGPYGPGMSVIRVPGAETSYKRTAEPSPSMRACSPLAVLRILGPMLSR